jgi:hypothetical protein
MTLSVKSRSPVNCYDSNGRILVLLEESISIRFAKSNVLSGAMAHGDTSIFAAELLMQQFVSERCTFLQLNACIFYTCVSL